MPKKLQFKIHSALKDIIGRDLIKDDFVAVFELVKNAYDAHATKVIVEFKNLYNSLEPEIIIKDNGKGMNYEDLLTKWLFLAYSAKKDGTEDDNYDYRDKMSQSRVFAGAKGIGRFACDKLGNYLHLETTKNEQNPQTEVLITDWSKFEEGSKDEFVDVDVVHTTKLKSDFGLEHGTVLKITGLRSEWDRAKLLKLKRALEKLINPSKGKGDHVFTIALRVIEERSEDKNKKTYHEKVDGPIRNFIFKTIGLKTTKIFASVSEDGKEVVTELIDGGSLIYRIVEKNDFNLLKSVDFTLFYLNTAAKSTFTRRMGMPAVQYGSIFLYKNGFRIYPYGEVGDDSFNVDRRKAQGQRRYLGNRDLMGQIEIYSDSDELKETTSRGDGLKKTPTFTQLTQYFLVVLRRLEKYVVEVQQWGLSIEDDDGNNNDLKERIASLIAKLTGNKDVLRFDYSDEFLNILESSQRESSDTIIKNLNRLAIESNNPELIEQTKKATNKLQLARQAKEEAEKETDLEKTKALIALSDLRDKESENLFLKSMKSQDFDEIISFLHHIGISANNVENEIGGAFQQLSREGKLSNDEIRDIFEYVSLETSKILTITRFATKANFKLFAEEKETDLVEYIMEYLNNIVRPIRGENLTVNFQNNAHKKFICFFKPIEISIIIDNLISNSVKAKANNVKIELNSINDKLEILFSDDGAGVDSHISNKLFEIGITSTIGGSGLGLFHVKKMLLDMGGDIDLVKNKPATFKITIAKN
jgi:signal transduction histidine kinase